MKSAQVVAALGCRQVLDALPKHVVNAWAGSKGAVLDTGEGPRRRNSARTKQDATDATCMS